MDLQDPLKPHEMAGVEPLRLKPIGTPGPLQSEGQALPIFGTLDGVAVAVVPLDDYKRLMLAALHGTMAKVDAAALPRPKVPPFGLSTIERDPEVAEFIRSRFRGGVTIDQIRDACRNKFGADRTPSRNRVQRFRQQLQRVR